MRVAYLINQYPTVSHTFIRREILALERRGFEIVRIAIRGWDRELIEPEDLLERKRTSFVLERGPLRLLLAVARMLFTQPAALTRAIALTVQVGWHAERPLPIHFAYLAEACYILMYILRPNDIQHVHAHFSTNSTEVAMLIHALGGPPYSFTAHGVAALENPRLNFIHLKIHRSKFTIGVCSFARAQLLRFSLPTDWNKIHVVHCGLDASFLGVPQRPIPSTRRLVCVGRLCREKAQLLLVDAARILKDQGVDFEIVLAGDGELRREIEEKVTDHKLQNRIRITGWLNSEQVREEILSARALILPSFVEGLPVVLMESMALGRPVISTYVAGIPELVRPGEHGWLVAAGDEEGLAEAMKACLGAPTDELERMGRAARERVCDRHDVNVEAAKIAKLIEDHASGGH